MKGESEAVLTIDPQTRTRISGLRDALVGWWPHGGRCFPWRVTDDDYLRLIAEVLLQRTRADAVAAVWPRFVERFPTVDHLHRARRKDVRRVVDSLGLGEKRVRNLKLLAGKLAHTSGYPSTVNELATWPGIGPYSAGMFLAVTRGVRTAPVDANVRRVLGRVALGRPASIKEATVLCQSLTEEGEPETVLFGLLDLGARPCGPREPSCEACPASRWCVLAAQIPSNCQRSHDA